MQVLTSLSTKGKITLAACALGFLAAAMFVVKLAGAPAYTTVMTGLDPAKTAKVTAALDAKGVGYELQNNGTALAVDKAKTTEAKAALAGAGVSAGAAEQPGYELLDKQKLGASSMQQQVAYQRALEGQIAQTISQIDGVGSATVRITLPKDDLFADDEKPATAAVLLGGDASTLEPGAVRGIASLVASSVEGLKVSAVTITDATGSLLWPSGEGGGDGMPASKPAAEARFAQQMETSLVAMLTRTLGPDKAQVEVRADLNVDEATREQLEYADRGTALSRTQESETLEGGAAAGGAAGVTANLPGARAGAGAGSNYERENTKTDYGVNKTVTRTRVAPGAVNKLSVSVLVDKGAKADVAALTRAVETAAGVDAARGDLVSVQEVAFAKLPEPAKPTPAALPVPPQFKPILSAVGIGGAVLLFLFFLSRHVKKREDEELADTPSWLASLQGPVPLAQIAAAEPQNEAQQVFQNDPRRVQLEEIVQREPDRVAQQLRSWITEDAS